MTYERTRRVDFHPFAWAAIVCTVLCVFVARPASADPAAPGIPDPGSRPVVPGSFQGPGASSLTGGLPTNVPPAVTTPGPLGQQIMTETAAVGLLEQQLLQFDANINEARHAADTAHQTWNKATQDLTDLRDRADHEAGEAYKAAAALGPLAEYASDLHQLSVLAPGIGQQPGGQATARDLERAEQLERGASAAYQAASARLDQLTHDRDAAKADYDRRNAALTDLRTKNSVAYQRELAAIDAQQAAIGAGLNVGGAVDGMTAAPKAVQAFNFAKTKLGRPYIWGAAGPDYFDCSGLMQWSYQQVGRILPRVANDQYTATTMHPAIDKLLVGDLLFFATDRNNSRSIHHVGMYAGNGYMIQAPNSGDVVKISPIWWSEYFGATRIFGEVPVAPAPAPPAKTEPPASPSPSKTASPSPSATASPSPSKTASPSPSKTGSPSPTGTPSGGGTTTPGSGGSTSPGGGGSTSPGGGGSTSPGGSTSAPADASGSASAKASTASPSASRTPS
jgi:peptidoglycan DL-endopeptidase CwlO